MKTNLTFFERKSIFFIFGLVLLFFACSCSTRKVQTEKTKAFSEVEASEQIKKDSTTQTVTNFDVKTQIDSTATEITETTIYTPIDNTKISTFTDEQGKKKDFVNTSIEKRKTWLKTNKKAIVSDNTKAETKHVNKGTVKKEVKAKSKSKGKAKQVDRKNASWSWLWFLLFILICGLLWKIRYKFLPILRIFKI